MSQAMSPESLAEIPMHSLVEQVLPFRSSKYVEDFCEKMLSEGIAAPADLLLVSKEALETKLSSHASFNFIEMADALSLRKAIDRTGQELARPGNGNGKRSRSPQGRQGRQGQGGGRARSRSPNGQNGRGRKRDNSGGRGGQRNNSRPHRNNRNNRNNDRHRNNSPQEKKDKPELWAAVEKNDHETVLQLLALGKDPEEKFEGWTPLMKASEEGAVEVMRILLEKKVDVEASNKKGRTALSFAAAPSMDGSTRRNTPVTALRLLLESGADAKHKDVRGMTAKECAKREKRDESLAIFEEFGC